MAKTKLLAPVDERSYFDGGFWGLLGYNLLTNFVTAITFGIAFPWMYCLKQRWIARHTVVCGKRMRFDGTGGSLIGHYLLWLLLTVVTFGIYGWWMNIALKKWITKNTHYIGEQDNNSYFDGGIGGYIGINLLCNLLTVCTLGIAAPWAAVKRIEWESRHTVIDSRRHVFVGTGGSLFVKRLLWGFLTGITFGIFAFWIPIKMQKWAVERTIDTEHTTEALIRRGEYRADVQSTAANLHAQRVQDEMELVQQGITAATDAPTLLAMAQTGCRSAQFEYVRRYSGGDYTAAPFAELLKSAADQGYAPAMCVYALSCDKNDLEMLEGAARNGQIPALLQLMRRQAQAGLVTREDDLALGHLEEAVRWYDILEAGGEPSVQEDTCTYEQCMMKLRRIRTKRPPKNTSVGAVIGILALVLVGIGLLAAIIGTVANLFVGVPLYKNEGVGNLIGTEADGSISWEDESPDADFDTDGELVFSPDGGSIGMDEIPAQGQSGSGFIAFLEKLFANQIGSALQGPALAPGTEDGIIAMPGTDSGTSDLSYMSFLEAFRQAMENEPHYYTVQGMASGTDQDSYTLQCSYYYWKSYFEMTVTFAGEDVKVKRIQLTGPRVYETIDENINALEFQSISRVLYQVLGLGDEMDITPNVDAGQDYTEHYDGWSFHYSHSADTLTLDIQAN